MKKFLFISIFLLLFIANNSFAITAGQIPTADQLGISDAPKIEKIDTLVDIVRNIVKWTYIIFFIVAVMFILFAAYAYLAAQGEPEAINKIKTQIMYAAIAIVVALMALSVELIIRNLISGGGAGGGAGGSGECSADRAEESRSGKPLCPQYWPQQGYNVRVQPFK